ncbi:MAG: dehydratase [Robiginitomaculum sp.]|nr:MAG: dehydratase [Robiginitomaculum sp.]
MNEYKFSDIYVGLTESFEAKITSEMQDRFLKICGDINPLHIEEEYARQNGFAYRVVYGLLTSSFYSTLVGVYLPGKYCILHGIDIQFSAPVFIGDVLKVTGKIIYINDAYKQLEIKAFITNQNNKKISKSIIKTGLLHE